MTASGNFAALPNNVELLDRGLVASFAAIASVGFVRKAVISTFAANVRNPRKRSFRSLTDYGP